MKHRLKLLAGAAVIAAAVATVPTATAAQASSAASSFDFTIQSGLSAPVSDLSDGWDTGANLGVAASFWLNDRFAVRLDGSVDLLDGKSTSPNNAVPDLNLFHLGAGLEYSVTDRATSNLRVNLNVGAGITRMQSDHVGPSSLSPTFGENYLHVNGGVEVAYRITDQVHLGVLSQAYITLADEDDTGFFRDFNPSTDLTTFSSAVTIPITVTLRMFF